MKLKTDWLTDWLNLKINYIEKEGKTEGGDRDVTEKKNLLRKLNKDYHIENLSKRSLYTEGKFCCNWYYM